MSECGSVHSSLEGVSCNRPGFGVKANHAEHSGVHEGAYIDWPNVAYEVPAPKEKKGGKSKGVLAAMAARVRNEETTAARPLRHYIPSESDARGRVALYLLKYLGEWIYPSEIELESIGGSAAVKKVHELINYGWPIEVSARSHEPVRYMLTSDPRAPLWTVDPKDVREPSDGV